MTNKHKRLRVLHLPVVVLNQAVLYCRALRRLGHKSDYLLYDVSAEDASLNAACDINLKLTAKGYLQRLMTTWRFVRRSLADYDIYHFHSGRTFIPLMAHSRWSFMPNRWGRLFDFLDFIDLPYLKQKRKKIVFQFWGCDIRDPRFEQRHDPTPCNVCSPAIRRRQCDLRLKNRIDRLTARYADLRLGTVDLLACYPDFKWVNNTIDTTDWQPLAYHAIPPAFRLRQNGKVKIYHSFSKSDVRGDIKGSRAIVRALKELRAEGHPVELIFCDYTPHRDIRYFQMQADIVVDQLRCGTFGNTGVECLSMGKPVVCYLRDDVSDRLPDACPVVPARPDTIKDVLRRLIVDDALRADIGRRSRRYARRHHDLSAVGRVLEGMYYQLF